MYQRNWCMCLCVNICVIKYTKQFSVFVYVIKYTEKCVCMYLIGLVWFYGISTIVRYIIPNPIYTYIHYIHTYIHTYIHKIGFGLILWHINHCRLFNAKSFYTYILNTWFLNTFCYNIPKWAQVHFLLNSFTYFSLIRIIPFTINHLFAHSFMFSSISMYH